MPKPAYTTVIASGRLLPSLEATRDLIARDIEACGRQAPNVVAWGRNP